MTASPLLPSPPPATRPRPTAIASSSARLSIAALASWGTFFLLALVVVVVPERLDRLDRRLWNHVGLLSAMPRHVARIGDPIPATLIALAVGVIAVLTTSRATLPAVRLASLVTPLVALASVYVAVERIAKPLLGRTIGTHQAWAFPSGHAAGLASLAGATAVIVVSPLLRRFLVTTLSLAATSVSLAMAASRSHYPTDVLAGWSLGLALGLTVARALQLVASSLAAMPRPPLGVSRHRPDGG